MKKIVKSIIIVLILAVVIFFIYKSFMFIYFNNIMSKVYENKDKNYYATVTQIDYLNNAKTELKYWNNDKFLKEENKYSSMNSTGEYVDDSSNLRFVNYEQNLDFIPLKTEDGKKVANMVYGTLIGSKGPFETYGYMLDYASFEEYVSKANFKDKINAYINLFMFEIPTYIKSENYEGKDCYLLIWGKDKYDSIKVYIEKSTYLPIAYIDGQNSKTNYDIDLRTVTDEEINYPDLSEYYTSIVYIEKY